MLDSGQHPMNDGLSFQSITFVDERGGEYNFLVDDVTLVNGSLTWAVTSPQGQVDWFVLERK